MQNNLRIRNVGVYIYAAGGIFLGVLGLVSGDFASSWQHVEARAPLRTMSAYFVALVELAGGFAIVSRRTARAGAAILTVVYSVFTLVWIPKYLENLHDFDPLGNSFEQFSLVVAGVVLFASFSRSGSQVARGEELFAHLYGFSVISFGIGHIFYMPGLLSGIPKWLPPSQMFWFYVTTIGFFFGAAAILMNVLAPLASRLVCAEIIGFHLLYWIPRLFKSPTHFNWAGNAISMALCGAAWVVADSISRTADRPRSTRILPGAPLTEDTK